MRSFNVHYVTTNFTFKPNSLIDYALCGTSFENIILTSFLTYAATDGDQTNPTKKWNSIQYFFVNLDFLLLCIKMYIVEFDAFIY